MKISLKKRKIGYTYGSVSGVFPFRGEKSICFESTLERDLLIILEHDSTVTDVIEQPISIEYTNNNGKNVTYTPDFLVHYRNLYSSFSQFTKKSKLIEVKPTEKIKTDWIKLKPKFKVGFSYAKQQGWMFSIYDDTRIRGKVLKNIQFLNRYKNYDFGVDENAKIFNHIQNVGHTAIDHVLEFIYATKDEKGIALSNIYHLLANRILSCDLTLPLNLITVIWINSFDEPFYEDEY